MNRQENTAPSFTSRFREQRSHTPLFDGLNAASQAAVQKFYALRAVATRRTK